MKMWRGQVLVVDFFFTRCATICPLLTTNMKRVQDRVLGDDRVRLMSHSVTPVADSVSVLMGLWRSKRCRFSALVASDWRQNRGL